MYYTYCDWGLKFHSIRPFTGPSSIRSGARSIRVFSGRRQQFSGRWPSRCCNTTCQTRVWGYYCCRYIKFFTLLFLSRFSCSSKHLSLFSDETTGSDHLQKNKEYYFTIFIYIAGACLLRSSSFTYYFIYIFILYEICKSIGK